MMKTSLLPIQIKSIYKVNGENVLLPKRMAFCTPDFFQAINQIANEVSQKGGELILSDMFRSYDMQYQANLDYKSGKKSAFSPPPGGSMHEAGRAFDIDLSSINIELKDFWEIAGKYGVTPIISEPDTRLKEAWHFDCRGSHALVYQYYKSGKVNNMKAYTAMAASAILAVGIKVDRFKDRQKEATLQFGLVRLGMEPGNIDGIIGDKTRYAINNAGIDFNNDISQALDEIENLLQLIYPYEYSF